MLKPTLALFLVTALFGACASNGGDDDMMGDDDPNLPPLGDGVATLSGAADAGYVDGPRGTARFANPVNAAFAGGKVYVADFDNGKIRVVDPESGQTGTLIAQDGFKRPFGMAATDDALYVTTDCNSTSPQQGPMTGTVWRVDIGARTATVVAENIGRPRGIAVLPDGRLAISDYQHHVIQLVDPATGAVTPLAGAWDAKGMVDGTTAARFSEPYGLAVLDGQLVVADFGNNRLRLVGLDGNVGTLTGEAGGFVDGTMDSARFDHPQGLAVDDAGRIYVTDVGNYRVRRIDGDVVETIAGSGDAGFADSEVPTEAQLFGLEGLAVSPDGSMVFVADGGRGENVPYNRVRRVKL